MSDPIPLRIMENLRDRLYEINRTNGYNYNPAISFGVREINSNELSAGPVIQIYELEDEVVEDFGDMCQEAAIQLTIVVEAYVRLGQDSSPTALALLFQDINKALFTADVTAGGLAHSVQRGSRSYQYPQSGGETVSVRQTALVLYSEAYGVP